MSDSLEVGSLTAKLELDDDEFGNKLDDNKEKMEDFGDTADDKLSVAIKVDDSEASKIDDVKSKMDELQGSGEGALALKADTSEAQSSLGGVEESLGSIQSMMETVGEIALFAAAIEGAAELIGKINECVEAYGELQYASAGAGLKAGGSPATTQAVMDLADEISVRRGHDTTEITDLISTIQGYGTPLSSITAESLTPYLNLADLPNVGMQDVGRLLALTKNNFGLNEGTASDMYARALESSNLSASSLSSAMPKMLLASKQANIPLDEMLSMMTAENQSKGADAAQTAMALFTGANKLTAPLDPMTMNAKGKMTGGSGIAKELQEEGVSLDAINNKSDSFLQKLVNLDKAGADFGKIFGAKQGDLLKDIADNAQGIEDFANTLENSQGAAQHYSDIMQDTLPKAEERFGDSVERLRTQIGSEFAPLKQELLEGGQGLIEALTQGIATGDFSGVNDALIGLWDRIDNYFSNVDYGQIGQDLERGLKGAIETAINDWNSSNYDLSSPFKALRQIFGPLFRDMQNAGIDAFNALGNGATQLANVLGSSVVGAINSVIDAFAELAGMADSATGGKISELMGLTAPGSSKTTSSASSSSSSSSGSSGSVYSAANGGESDQSQYSTSLKEEADRLGIDLDAKYTNSVSGMTSTGADWVSRGTDPTHLTKASSSKSSSSSSSESDSYSTAKSYASNPSALASNFVSSPSAKQIDIGGTGATGWQALDDFVSELGKPIDTNKAFGYGTERQDEANANQALYSGMWTAADVLAGNSDAVHSTLSEAKTGIESIPESQRTENQKAMLSGITNKDSLNEHIDALGADLQQASKTPDKSNESGSALESYIKERWGQSTWKDLEWQDIKKSSELFSDDVDVLRDGIFETSQGLDGFSDSLSHAASSTHAAAETTAASASKYDASTNMLADYMKNLMASCDDCAMSEWGLAQEANSSKLFFQDFAGATSDYTAFLAEETARGAIHPAVTSLGYDYSAEAEVGASSTKPVDLDVGAADSKLAQLTGQIEEKRSTPVEIDDSGAMSAISALDEAAGGTVVKTIIIETIYAGGGGGGEGYDNMADAVFNLPVQSFASGDVFVPAPTLAVVGDQPGGEWIGSIEQAQSRFGGQGGQGISISAPLVINAPVYGVDDLNGILTEHREGIMRAIHNSYQGGL